MLLFMLHHNGHVWSRSFLKGRSFVLNGYGDENVIRRTIFKLPTTWIP
uniref:Uncharacterized protein n=1 Tax=Arundo donax TaxID=35708 RepID=A0A0A9BA46_ARUDO